MKSLTLLAALMLGFGAVAFADEAKTPAPTTQPAAKPVNTKCPVSGDPIDPKVTVTQDGKLVAFCCKDCIDEFKKNPDKYMKDLK